MSEVMQATCCHESLLQFESRTISFFLTMYWQRGTQRHNSHRCLPTHSSRRHSCMCLPAGGSMSALPRGLLVRSAMSAHRAVVAGPVTAGGPTVSLMRRGAAGMCRAADRWQCRVNDSTTTVCIKALHNAWLWSNQIAE
jgi:hypothetical protein